MLNEPIKKKNKKPTQLCISDRLNEGQFLFYSIIFYTKIKSSFILQVFWTCYIKFFSNKKKNFKSNKTSKHIRSKNSSCHSTWPILEMRVSRRSTTRQLSELEVGRWINTNRNRVFLKYFSCLWELNKEHIRSQAELVNKFCSGGSKGGETSWDERYS